MNTFKVSSKQQRVESSHLHYLDAGEGDPILFLHGNPTSSYLWRNVIPHLTSHGRCIAVDLIGMGKSGKPDIDYCLVDHINYISAFVDALGLENLTLVMHDWGVTIGLDFARHHPERVRAVAFMEGHIHPVAKWDDFDEGSRTMFQDLRTEGVGQQMVIENNFFIETILPAGTKRTLTAEDMDAYRAPYLDKHARKPLWRWPNEIPIEGVPAAVTDIVTLNQRYLAHTGIPKLLLYATPGAVIGSSEVAWCKETLSNLTAINLGEGLHFLPEDHPEAIGAALSAWLRSSA